MSTTPFRSDYPGFDAGANFVMRHKLTSVELVQLRLNFFAEPCIMVEVMLDKLPGIFLRAAIIFCGDACQLRLKFWVEVNFHTVRLSV